MADDRKNMGPEAEKPGEAPQEKKAEPVKNTPPAPEQLAPGAAAAPVVETAPKVQTAPAVESKPEEKSAPAPKVLDFSVAKNKAPVKEEVALEKKPVKEQATEKPKRGRPAKADKAPTGKPKLSRDKMSQSKAPATKEEAAASTEPEQPAQPRDATRAEKEEIVYLNLSELHPFQNHPFGVRDDAEMQGLVESVKAAGVNQPALVRPREGGGYEIIAGHRRQRASELAGFFNMPCIVRNMTDDEAILAMTDDNLRHREKILPTEKAQSLKMQVEAIKHQGARPGEDAQEAGKRSTQIVGDRNGMNYKQVQRYIRLTELVPDLQKMLDEKKLSFTPAV